MIQPLLLLNPSIVLFSRVTLDDWKSKYMISIIFNDVLEHMKSSIFTWSVKQLKDYG